MSLNKEIEEEKTYLYLDKENTKNLSYSNNNYYKNYYTEEIN
jgi:hypothetical protein